MMKRKLVIFEVMPDQNNYDSTAQLVGRLVERTLPPGIAENQVIARIQGDGFEIMPAKHFSENKVIEYCERASGYASKKNVAKYGNRIRARRRG